MTTNRVIVDTRRHRGSVDRVIRAVNLYVANLGGGEVDWITTPEQSSPAFVNRIGTAASDSATGSELVRRHLLDHKSSTQDAKLAFWVLSYDNALLSSARALVTSGADITTVHLGDVFVAMRPAARPPLSLISVEEAAVTTRQLLAAGGFTSPSKAMYANQLRPRLASLNPRAAKQRGAASDSLIRDVIVKGTSEGWLGTSLSIAGRGETEVIFLKPISTSIPEQTIVETSASAPSAEADVDPMLALRKVRASQFEKFLTAERIGAFPRTRQLLLESVLEVTTASDYVPSLLSNLLDEAETKARAKAVAIRYTQENGWGVATRCIGRLMCRAGVLTDGKGNVIGDGIGRDSRRVHHIEPDLHLVCEGFLAEQIIRAAESIDYDDDSYYLGLTIYRGGAAERLTASELKEKADVLLTFLEQEGRIMVGDDDRIRLQAPEVRIRIPR